MRIVVVGVCVSGKSTLVEGLRSRGYNAYHVAQEHSSAGRMWSIRRPDFVVFLDCPYEIAARRRAVPWGPSYLAEQRRRLADARAHCNLYIDTGPLTEREVLETVIAELEHKARGGPVEPVTLDLIKRLPEVDVYISRGDDYLGVIGYTEHGRRHASLVANIARNVLTRLGFPEREAELAGIAGYLHDIGNLVNRWSHGQTGAMMAFSILRSLGMPPEEIAAIAGAIGSHDPEDAGFPVNNISAALILGDKSDVHRTRVRNTDRALFDIHDRVNYAVEHSFLRVDDKKKSIVLELNIDTKICPVMDYFEIFLNRMIMCRRATSMLGCSFELSINDVKIL